METNGRYLAVGIFVLCLLAALVGFILWIGKPRHAVERYDIFFEGSVTGLKEGASVLYKGVPVGTVGSITIDTQKNDKVLVIAKIAQETPIFEDSVASLEMQGMTGIAYVQISGGTPESGRLTVQPGRDYPIIRSKPSTLEQLMSAAPRLLNNLNTLTDRLSLFFDEKNQESISHILSQGAKITEALEEEVPSVLDQMKKTFSKIQDVSQNLQMHMDQTMAHIIDTSKNLSSASQQIALFLEDNRPALSAFLTNGLYDLSGLLVDMRSALSSIHQVTTQFQRGPLNFLLGKKSPGYQLPK